VLLIVNQYDHLLIKLLSLCHSGNAHFNNYLCCLLSFFKKKRINYFVLSLFIPHCMAIISQAYFTCYTIIYLILSLSDVCYNWTKYPSSYLLFLCCIFVKDFPNYVNRAHSYYVVRMLPNKAISLFALILLYIDYLLQ
jgi:hypothetical protein